MRRAGAAKGSAYVRRSTSAEIDTHPKLLCVAVPALWTGRELKLGVGKYQGDDDCERRKQKQRDQPKIQFGGKKRWRAIAFAEQTALVGHGTLP
jgi:hypothetical protein